jgi:flagellar P-ring protein precursor FlgI
MKPIRIVLVLLCFFSFLHSEKIKEVSSVVGVRDNQLIGYGLVVGLNGTGDGTSSTFTAQSLANLLQGVNVKVNADDIKSKNVAAVMVTAKLPAFSRQGDKLDVIVSSIGDAKSIGGGTLLMTPLKGVDGKIYALAQGPVGIGGRNARGGGGDGNHPLAGVLLGGGVVERSVAYSFANQTRATISLNSANFMNAVAIQNTINQYFLNSAEAHDPRTVTVEKPDDMSMVEFLATVNELEITYDREQKVVIHERTGTVVAGIDVTVEPVVVTQGEITVKIDYPSNVADGGIDMGDGINIDANKNIINSNNRPTVANIARSLQKLGATPNDIISVIEAMKMAGAITATVEII